MIGMDDATWAFDGYNVRINHLLLYFVILPITLAVDEPGTFHLHCSENEPFEFLKTNISIPCSDIGT